MRDTSGTRGKVIHRWRLGAAQVGAAVAVAALAEAAPGSASKILVRLVDLAAFGELDRDGARRPDRQRRRERHVRRRRGGAERRRRGTPGRVAPLGDRVLVREVRVDDGRIVVRLRARGAADPFALVTQEISRRYALAADGLVLVDETTADVPLTPADDFVYRPERVDVAAGSARTLNVAPLGVLTTTATMSVAIR